MAIILQTDAAANDSDKTFTVTAGTAWKISSIYVSLASTATVGNRLVVALLTDASDNAVAAYHSTATQAASLTRTYLFAPLGVSFAAFNGSGHMQIAINEQWLPGGYKIRVYDSAAIDAAADDMTIRMFVEEAAIG